ncbi:MAG: hydantoinase B/oxoprolinase family protein [Alphaproteobacteria bacterium]|nr:hydantoinase B/oxoprolinase family protein [Alphaproteobacteria bacterium]
MTRQEPEVDIVTFEVLRHRLWELNDEMALMVGRISGAPSVYESGDFNVAILTPDGQGLYTGVFVVRQASALDVVVQNVIRMFGDDNIHDGDAFMTSDPWYGALHAMDAAVVMPVFHDGVRVAWTGVVVHEIDMGGSRPGSWCVGARDAYQEVPLTPPVKIVDKGVVRKDVETTFLRNSRTPEMNALNLRAKIAAQNMTGERLREIIDEYGRDTFLAVQQKILDYVERSIRQRLSELPDGTWYANAFLDHDGLANRLYRLRLALTKSGDQLTFDFSGTDPQAPGTINCAWSGLVGGILQVAFPLLCYDIPWSHGAVMRCIDIVSQEGTINNALFPAGTSMATVNACQSTGNLVWEAMARMYGCGTDALREEVIALGYGGVNMSVIAGRHGDDRPFVNLFTDSVGGGGARSFGDGIDTCGNFIAPAYGIPNVERIESLVPMLYVYRREREETAGAGQFRGGVGLEYMLVPHGTDAPMEAVLFSTGCAHMETKGVAGGLPGSIQRNVVLHDAGIRDAFAGGRVPTRLEGLEPGEIDIVEAKDVRTLTPDDAWLCLCTGGGGYGDPLRRDPELTARDVRQGLCTNEEARRLYGVVLDNFTRPDADATQACRDDIRAARRAGGTLPEGAHGKMPFDGRELFRVGEILAVREGSDGPVLGCRECGHAFGRASDDPRKHALLIEREIEQLSPVNTWRAESDVVLREYACPGCATVFSTDLQRRD